jgi:tRNA-specific 2-thiouridylase
MKLYVGLSGGVDSSVAAALLLKRQGHDVTGVYMKNWSQDLPGVRCPWREDLRDARAVAARLDIPFKVYDFETEYRERVVGYLLDEYRAGRTPNPDIMCNQEIKFKLFLETALADGADMIATGHYARTRDGRLLRAKDENKDQTYFLYRISAEALRKTLFPIGDYTKPEVRALAAELGLPTAAKKDSQGICFVGPVGMRAFLSQHVETHPGPIKLRGEAIGQHDGAIFYTIGQRQGLGVGGGRPYYVTDKDMESNTVYVTDDPADLELRGGRVELEDAHWINGTVKEGETYLVRFRHRGELVECELGGDDPWTGGLNMYIHMFKRNKSVHALAAGQSAVIYDGEVCLGGGIISHERSGRLTRNHSLQVAGRTDVKDY